MRCILVSVQAASRNSTEDIWDMYGPILNKYHCAPYVNKKGETTDDTVVLDLVYLTELIQLGDELGERLRIDTVPTQYMGNLEKISGDNLKIKRGEIGIEIMDKKGDGSTLIIDPVKIKGLRTVEEVAGDLDSPMSSLSRKWLDADENEKFEK